MTSHERDTLFLFTPYLPPMLKSVLPPKMTACLLLIWLLPGASAAQTAIDFAAVTHAARLAALAYQPQAVVRRTALGDGNQLTAYQTLQALDLAWFIVTNEQNRTQIIALRGTSSAENALVDISVKLVRDPLSGLMLHEGFSASARKIFQSLRSRLNRQYRIDMTGHSMGGALALIVAKYLADDGFRVGQIITFGQPKVTNFNGAKAFAALNVIRIVTPLDMVPLTPPFDPVKMATGNLDVYWHVGTEVLLLEGHRYSILQGVQSMMRTTGFTRQDIAAQALNHHSMDYYLQLLQGMDVQALQVPFESGFNLFRLFAN